MLVRSSYERASILTFANKRTSNLNLRKRIEDWHQQKSNTHQSLGQLEGRALWTISNLSGQPKSKCTVMCDCVIIQSLQKPFHPLDFATANLLFQSLQLYRLPSVHGLPTKHEHPSSLFPSFKASVLFNAILSLVACKSAFRCLTSWYTNTQ